MHIEKGNYTDSKLLKQTMKSLSKFDIAGRIKPPKQKMRNKSDSKMRGEELNKNGLIELLGWHAALCDLTIQFNSPFKSF
jgi:hypothetical protein